MIELCLEHNERYDDEQYQSCYQCFLERRSEYFSCIFCGRWHSPRFNTCFKCRNIADRDEAAHFLRLLILMRDGFTCQICGTERGNLQVDHIRPCARGGTASPWNLQVLCQPCNQAKRDTWWIGSRYDENRVRLMRVYFTFNWRFLDDEQRTALRMDANPYGSMFDRHARRHGIGCECDRPECVPAWATVEAASLQTGEGDASDPPEPARVSPAHEQEALS